MQRDAIAAAAKELDALRNAWLNPPEWTKTEILEFPGSVGGPGSGICTIPTSAASAWCATRGSWPGTRRAAEKLKKRTLTNLYNEMPTWLRNAHRRLDEAVFAAYGWPPDLSDDDLLARLLELNLSRAGGAES